MTSDVVSTSQPLAPTPSQSANPATQVPTPHSQATQAAAVAWAGVVQATPPQLPTIMDAQPGPVSVGGTVAPVSDTGARSAVGAASVPASDD